MSVGERKVYELKENWQFIKKDLTILEVMQEDNHNWENVRVPHDWAIDGPFARDNDLQHTAIVEDGVKRKEDHTGRTGGLPITGTGWYRKELQLKEKDWRDNGWSKKLFLEFDGIMSNSTIYINGQEVGKRPYGYSSFSLEITDYLQYGQKNILAVKVEPELLASRWYPGAGIYRNVRFVSVKPVYVTNHGTYLTTPRVTTEQAVINLSTTVRNQTDIDQEIELKTVIMDDKGREVTSSNKQIVVDDETTCEQELIINNPRLWDVDDPFLYRVVNYLVVEDELMDKYQHQFGTRTIAFDADKGFSLNGRNLKLKGVCLHHDNGPLGTAINRRAVERKLELLKDMGCNAIRTSHNPPSPELLDLCDDMGFLVIDEAFDEWQEGKLANGYHKYFADWAETDLRDMIKSDRNHPSVIMWSIGNEIREQGQEKGAEVAQYLTDICHEEDPTRPVTAGFNNAEEAITNGLAEVVDVVGWNYEYDSYDDYRQQHPDWIMYGSETESCLSTRGEYYFPVEERNEARKHETLQVSSYDLCGTSWGYPPDYEFKAQEECPYLLGEFVWTGIDYLGEPTPYYTEWPSRSSYFGIIDLCGIPKDRYYLYRSHWSDKPTLHILPHWNWQGKEGEIVPVYCYTNYDAAELFVNGKSQGIRKKDPAGLFTHYRLIWDNVKYEPGTIKVVAYDEEGQSVLTEEVKTAGKPAHIELEPDRNQLTANGDDLCYITVNIKDENDQLCPTADNLVSFSVKGQGEIAAVGNGDPTSTDPFKADYRKSFNGKCILIVRTHRQESEIVIKATAEGLQGDKIKIQSKI